ncbi:MAG TPA: efflux RND transporter periplasmic adaptor subunit [Acetobacteraceae bacterium]|nr:efflux RND transporter periplasmic adaptor subunit [Acetobacteraceae bacterium]
MQDTFAETIPPVGLEQHHPVKPGGDDAGHGHSEPSLASHNDGPPPVKRGRLLIYGLGGLTAAILLAVYGVVDRGKSEDTLVELTAQEAIPTVDVIKPQVGVTGQEVVLPGTINAFFQAPIYARVSGYLKMWYYDIGAHVKAGEKLASIETPDLDQELAQAKANLGVAVANYKLAQLTAARWQKLLKSDAVAVQDVDVKTGDSAAKQAAVTAAQANVDRLQALEAFKRIVSPFDGVITARKTDVGALINAGSGVGPELFAVADIHEMRVYVRVPQSESADITNGMQAFLSLPQYPGKKFPATVATTANAIDPVSNTLLVQLTANNPDGILTPGTFAQVHFELPARPDVVRIPTSALLFRQDGLKVAVLGSDGKVEIKPIRAGRDLGTQMEVLAGLTPTDRLINSPPDSLLAGETVHVTGEMAGKASAGNTEVSAR